MIAPLARVLGVDGAAHATLLRLFRTLYRRSGTNALRRGTDARPTGTWWVWVAYACYGLIAATTAFFRLDRGTYAAIVAGSALVLVGLAVVADFAAMVVAPGDDDVLFHLPLESRTYLSARLAFAAQHAAWISIAYGVAPAVAGAITYREPAWAVLFLGSIVACGWLSLLVAFAVYRVALRWLGGERLRTVVAYLPGLFSILLYLGPQLLRPRTLASADSNYAQPLGDYVWAAPPAWFAAIPEVVFGRREPAILVAAALGVLVLPVSFAILIRALGKGFLDDLRRMLGASAEGPVARGPRRPLAPSRLVRRLFGIDTADGRAGYLLCAAASRSRESRARVLPMLAMPVVFALVAVLDSERMSLSLWAPCLVGVSAATLWGLTSYHETPDAAWVLAAVPLPRYGQMLVGMASAIVVRQVLPAGVVVIALRFAADPTPESIASSLHGFLGSLLGLPMVVAGTRHVPYTLAYRSAEGGRGFARAFGTFLVAALVLIVERILAQAAPWALWITPPAFAIALVVWMRAVAADLDAVPAEDLRPMRTAST